MPPKRLTGAELRLMRIFWEKGPQSIRELIESIPGKRRPAYTTAQTLVYRLEDKGAVRRTRKIGGAHIFEAIVSRSDTQGRMFDELLELFGGRAQPLVSHLIETGRFTLDDVEEAKRQLTAIRSRKEQGKEE